MILVIKGMEYLRKVEGTALKEDLFERLDITL